MIIAITGGTGFIGRHLVLKLQEQGWNLRILCRPRSPVSFPLGEKTEVVTGDIRDPASMDRLLLGGTEAVFHLAACTRGADWPEFYETTVLGTKYLLDVCVKRGIGKFVYVGSAVHDIARAKNGCVMQESFPLEREPHKRTYYIRAKILAEEVVLDSMKKGEFSLVILRPGIVYGPEQPFCSTLFPGLKGRLYLALGNPKRQVPLTHVDDLVDAFLLALRLPHSGVYHVVDDRSPSYREYLSLYMKLSRDKTPVLAVRYGPLSLLARCLDAFLWFGRPHYLAYRLRIFCRDIRYDTTKARRELGWTPKVTFESGLRLALNGAAGGQGR